MAHVLAYNNPMRLDRLILRCNSPETLAAFYKDHLGMAARPEGASWVVGYGGPDAEIELRPATQLQPYGHSKQDRYWKIGIMVPNLDLAHSILESQGIAVSAPHLFEDIGYMCHLEDPEGFQIELLQQTFPDAPNTLGYLLSDTVFSCIGQITLRTGELDADLAEFRDGKGMTLVSVQPVPKYGFTLYFLAFGDTPPEGIDLTSVENRRWLWQRPYTCLELQAKNEKVVPPSRDDLKPGFVDVTFTNDPKDQ